MSLQHGMCLHKVKKQAKLTHSERFQKSTYLFERGSTGKRQKKTSWVVGKLIK